MNMKNNMPTCFLDNLIFSPTDLSIHFLKMISEEKNYIIAVSM